MRFGLEGGKSVILDRAQATTDGPIILKQHAITSDRSPDLQRATNNNVTAAQPGTLCSNDLEDVALTLKCALACDWMKF